VTKSRPDVSHCEQCGETFSGIDSCPRCDDAHKTLAIPLALTDDGWVEQRSDGTTWIWDSRTATAVPTMADFPSASLQECPNGHTYRRLLETSCPGCSRNAPLLVEKPKVLSSSRRSFRWVYVVLVGAGIAGAIWLSRAEWFDSNDTAGPASTSTSVAATTTSIQEPVTVDEIRLSFRGTVMESADELRVYATEAVRINQRWDERILSFADTEGSLVQLMEDVSQWSGNINIAAAPHEAQSEMTAVWEVSRKLVLHVESMLFGLRDPNSSRGRVDALAAFLSDAGVATQHLQTASDLVEDDLRRPPGTLASVESLIAGDCFEKSNDAGSVHIADCSTQHGAEILAVTARAATETSSIHACIQEAARNAVDWASLSEASYWSLLPSTGARGIPVVCAMESDSRSTTGLLGGGPQFWPLLIEIDTRQSGPHRGECLVVPEPDEQGSVPIDLPPIPCDEPHEFQVVAVGGYVENVGYPGETALFDSGNRFCAEMAEEYVVGYVGSNLLSAALIPTQQEWSTGFLEVSCLLSTFDGSTTIGSALKSP